MLGAFCRDVLQGLIMPAWVDTACAFYEAGLFTPVLSRSSLSLGIDIAGRFACAPMELAAS